MHACLNYHTQDGGESTYGVSAANQGYKTEKHTMTGIMAVPSSYIVSIVVFVVVVVDGAHLSTLLLKVKRLQL